MAPSMLPPLRTFLAALVGVALLVPVMGAAAVRGDPPVTTPVETAPPPADPAPPEEPPTTTVEVPDTITLQVPPLPEPKHKPVAAPPQRKVVRPKAHARSVTHARPVTHARVERVAEPEREERVEVAPPAKPSPKPKPKSKARKKAKHARQHLAAPVRAPLSTRDPGPAQGVLAARFSAPAAITPAATHRTVLYLALALAAALGTLFGLVGAAPALAGRWPNVFVPVIDATERIVLAGVCLVGAALTLALTWVLTGSA